MDPSAGPSAGVDIDAGNETVRRIKSLARGTFTPGVLSDIGSFGGLFRLDRDRYREPVLVSSADGVGTKLKVAFMTGRHDTVGADLVNHCVNDILVQGASRCSFSTTSRPGGCRPTVAEQVVSGVARGCRENGCALIGGETAEMPGFYADGEYDIAGFIVGVVEQAKVIDGRRDRARRCADRAAVGRPAHQRIFAGAARVVRHRGLQPDTFVRELGATVGDALLAPHRSYLGIVAPLLERGSSRAWRTSPAAASPRICRECCRRAARAEVDLRAWTVPPLFSCIAAARQHRARRDVPRLQHGHRPDHRLRGRATRSA